MMTESQDLQQLTNKLLEEVKNYGILEVSIEQYKNTCRCILNFAKAAGQSSYSPGLLDDFQKNLDDRVNAGEICHEYCRFQKRVVRMLSSLAETGKTDFSAKKSKKTKYPVPDDISALVEDILNAYPISAKTKVDLRAPIRHIFWYAQERHVPYDRIDDALVMEFIINEIPKTNGGSTGRTIRCVKYVTEYLKANGNTNIRYDYRFLTIKNDHRRIIPAFSEEEISAIVGSMDIESNSGKRDYAIILLAYCTGLRGADIALLKLKDIDWRNQKLFVSQSKTHAPVVAELNGQAMNALADYVLEARPSCDVPEIFVTVNAPYRRLSNHFAGRIDKYCKKASVNKIPLRAFHSLRRSFETVMVSRGVPIETASQMMGHKNISEEKPYITHDKEKSAFVAMDFSDVPIRAGIYAKVPSSSVSEEGGDDK